MSKFCQFILIFLMILLVTVFAGGLIHKTNQSIQQFQDTIGELDYDYEPDPKSHKRIGNKQYYLNPKNIEENEVVNDNNDLVK